MSDTKIIYENGVKRRVVVQPIASTSNADITKAEIEAKLTGVISSHSHAIGSATWKTGIVTKNITDASTTQNIPHGLGRVPKLVRIDGAIIITNAITQMCPYIS